MNTCQEHRPANPTILGALAKNHARLSLDAIRFGELIELICALGVGDEASRTNVLLGGVYEDILGKLAAAEGKSGGEFCTPPG